MEEFLEFLLPQIDDGGSGVFGIEQSTYFKREGNWLTGDFASGGTRNTPGDGYAYHTFQVSDNSQPTGVFNMPDAVGASTIEILLVGGGGGGGNYPSGNSGGLVELVASFTILHFH